MNSYDVWRLYTGLKLHFHYDYDFFKYRGRNKRLTVEAFEKRNDKTLFKLLRRHNDILGYLVANFMVADYHIGDLVKTEQCKQNYTDWKKRLSSLTYTFKEELAHVLKDGPLNFQTDGSTHPPIIRAYLAKRISFETLMIVTELTGMKEYLDKQLCDDIIWKSLSDKFTKYSPFLSYPKKRFQQILVDHFAMKNENVV